MGHLRELCTASLPEQAAPLIDVILRLLSFAVQLKINRQALIVHAGEWQTFSTFITLLKMTAQQRPTLAHQLLTIMEAAFKEASTILSTESYKDFVLNCGTQQVYFLSPLTSKMQIIFLGYSKMVEINSSASC